MKRLKFLLAVIFLAILFSHYVTPAVSNLTFGEASRFSLIVYRLFGLLFAGVSLIYSLFWLDSDRIFFYCKRMLFFLFAFVLLSVVISHLLVLLVAQFIPHFEIQFADQIFLSYQEIIKLFSPFSFIKNPATLWLIGCGVIGIALSKTAGNKFQVNAGLTLCLSTLNQIFRVLEVVAPIPLFFLAVLLFDSAHSPFTYEMILFIAIYVLASFFCIFYAMPIFWGMRVKGSFSDFFRLIFYPSLFAFGFGDVVTALPILFYLTQELNSKYSEKERGEVAGIVIPFAYLMLPLANLIMASIPLLVFYLLGQSTEIKDQVIYVVTSTFVLFSPQMPGPGIMAFLLDILKLPQDATTTFIEVSAYLSHIHAFVSCFSIGFIVFYTLSEKEEVREEALRRGFKYAIRCSLLLIFVLASSIYLMDYSSKSYKEEKKLAITDVEIASPVEIAMVGEEAKPLGIRSLQEIIDSKILRIGYGRSVAPFSYTNFKKDVVGFDIELMTMLAADLECKLELYPLDYSRIGEQLLRGDYDIGVGEVTITVGRLKQINFTNPVMATEKVLLAKDYKRIYFDEPERMLHDRSFKLASIAGTSLEEDAKRLFPKAVQVPIKFNDEIVKPNIADALFTTRQEAYHWVAMHPAFTIISLDNYSYPTKENVAYAVNYSSKDLVEFLNLWLLLQQTNKVIETLEKKWQMPPPTVLEKYTEEH